MVKRSVCPGNTGVIDSEIREAQTDLDGGEVFRRQHPSGREVHKGGIIIAAAAAPSPFRALPLAFLPG